MPAAEERQRPVDEDHLVHGLGNTLQLASIASTGMQGRHQTAREGSGQQIRTDTDLLQHRDHPKRG